MGDATFSSENFGIPYLERLWARALGKALPDESGQACPHEQHLDHVVLNCIGLDIVQPYRFLLYERPDFARFSAWIMQVLGGPPSLEQVSLANRSVADYMAGNFRRYPLTEAPAAAVLTPEQIRFWDENGYVVFENAISADDAAASAQVLWNFLGLSPDAPDSWYQREQPFWAPLFHHPQLDQNRSSLRIRSAFAQLWGTDHLVSRVNQTSFNPPVRDGVDHSGPSKLHWDTSLASPVSFELAGILYLNDVADDQGAFRCVPGFHQQLERWLADLPDGVNPRDVDMEPWGAVAVGGKAGDMVIWRQELPHGSGKNRSTLPRLAQYISWYPPDHSINPAWK